MLVRFWGVRGSIAAPGKYTMKYGGNTPCIEIRDDDGSILIIDSGTGIRNLGHYMLLNDLKSNDILDINILITHTHWDHIQGFPFFVPAFMKKVKIKVWGPINLLNSSLENVFQGQMAYSYFPVNFHELDAEISFSELKEQTWNIGQFKINSFYLNHTILCLGYRIEYKNKVIVTVYDNEPYQNFFQKENTYLSGSKMADEWITVGNNKIFEYSKNADLLICDSQYTKEEYQNKIGWGHSTIDFALNLGKIAKCPRLALFHHDPLRTDYQIDKMQIQIHDEIRKERIPMFAFFASEGLEITI